MTALLILSYHMHNRASAEICDDLTVPFGSCKASTYNSTTFKATPQLMELDTIVYMHLSSKPALSAARTTVVTQLYIHACALNACKYVRMRVCVFHSLQQMT